VKQGLPEVVIPELLSGDKEALVLCQEEACSEELTVDNRVRQARPRPRRRRTLADTPLSPGARSCARAIAHATRGRDLLDGCRRQAILPKGGTLKVPARPLPPRIQRSSRPRARLPARNRARTSGTA